jgi:hypothetical protein
VRPLLVAAALLALACLVPLASAQQLGAVPTGNYTMVDGPVAGQDIYVGGSGAISILDRKTNARVVAADDDCDEPHLHGTIDGKDEPAGGCGWGRVLVLTKATPTLRALANAITEEERAVASINAQPPTKLHWELVLYGQLGIEHALAALAEAEKSGAVSSATADRIRSRLNLAHGIDEKVKKAMQVNPNADPAARNAYVRQLRNALSLKREALTMVDHAGLKVSDGADAPTPCGGRRVAAVADCVVTAFWDVNVPKGTKSALCVATNRGRRTDAQHPLFAGVKQVQRCTVTNRLRRVGGELKRVVHFQITLTGTVHGTPKPVRVTVYWPA